MPTNKEYEIDIDPRILELLGPNLYTNIYYVLAELIANAYDANAHNVYIISDDGSITVEDDGHGMSYKVGVKKFLNVAHESRTDEESSYVSGSGRKRKKMGRKGVGKLAALSVSENVEVKTIKDGDKSGFVLSRRVNDDHKLAGIDEEKINFYHVKEHGTAVVMKTPQYRLHKTIKAAKNNLLKIFPLVNEDFRIHLQVGNKVKTIESFEEEIIEGLGGLITLGDDFSFLHDHFDSQLGGNKEEEQLNIKKQPHVIPLEIEDKQGERKKFNLEIKGWIGAYRSSRGKKQDLTDFPDNFISILSNKKLGEFNILPIVGKNALNEVYVVGQLHIDLFEETSLPDMALSNRQGYKSDDVRYETAIQYVREALLPQIISLRARYTVLKKDKQDKNNQDKSVQREVKFKEQVDKFKQKASEKVAKQVVDDLGGNQAEVEQIVKKVINNNLPHLGIKRAIDDNKKKLLLSHSASNKAICDVIYDLLVYSGIPSSSIIYSSSDSASARIPHRTDIFKYLRDFFVNSYSDEKIFVIYVTSKEMAKSWAAISEVGAGWITQNDHEIFNIADFTPKAPLDITRPWANIFVEGNDICLGDMEIDILAEKIEFACETTGFTPQSKENIIREIKRKVKITEKEA